jgi:hypothetical protein
MAYDKDQAKAQVKRVHKYLASSFDELAASVVNFSDGPDLKRYIRANIRMAVMSWVLSVHPANLKLGFRFLVGSMEEKTTIIEAIVESSVDEIMGRVAKLREEPKNHLQVVK